MIENLACIHNKYMCNVIFKKHYLCAWLQSQTPVVAKIVYTITLQSDSLCYKLYLFF